jgi:hypothetical protein
MVVVGGIVILVNVLQARRRDRPRVIKHEERAANWEPPPTVDLSALYSSDAAFSLPVFENFAFELVSAVHRGRDNPQQFASYLEPKAIAAISGRGAAPAQVVIGALRIEELARTTDTRHLLTVRVESTLIGSAPTLVVENWKFARTIGATSSAPTGFSRSYPCKKCGAVSATGDAKCAQCGEAIPSGNFDWKVTNVIVLSETTAQASLTGTVEEVGNDYPTVKQKNVDASFDALEAADSNVTWSAFQPRVERIYAQLNEAWNSNDLRPVRGYVTASLRNYLAYWLREYEAQGLRNTLHSAAVKKIELAKVTRDRYYDAITVRIFATGIDSTTNRNGAVVGGSSVDFRDYTEYWTFIRSAGRNGPINKDPVCAKCAAPIDISDVGECTHCHAMIESGEYDWTLSKIEQDDSYGG